MDVKQEIRQIKYVVMLGTIYTYVALRYKSAIIAMRRVQEDHIRSNLGRDNFSSQGELIGRDSSQRSPVCIRPLTLSNINISETSGPIAIKFYLKHNWGGWSGGKAALGFKQERIRTMVSMATDSSNTCRGLKGKIL